MIIFFSSSSAPWVNLSLFLFAASLVIGPHIMEYMEHIVFLPLRLLGLNRSAGPLSTSWWERRSMSLEQALHEQRMREAVHEQHLREQRIREAEVPVSGLARMICLGLAVTLSLCICRFLIKLRGEVQRIGVSGTLREMRATPLRQWPIRWFFANEQVRRDGGAPTPGAGGAETHEQRVERVSKRVQQLPTEEFMDMEDMKRLPLRQLKEKLDKLGLKLRPGEGIDRPEAIKLALEIGGSSSTSCAVCCEDFASGELLRKLPACGHRFHLECIDRWLFLSADYSRRKACCPMCNTEI